MTPADLGRVYGVPVMDWERPGTGTVLTNGAGIGMAAMDSLPCCRWLVSLDGVTEATPEWLSFAEALGYLSAPLVACLWFGIDRPEPVAEVLSKIESDRLIVYSQPISLGHGQLADDWSEMVTKALAA